MLPLTVRLPPTIGAPDRWSNDPVPPYMNLHCLLLEPKSYVKEALGKMLELTSAPNERESVPSSPKIMFPETNSDPDTLTVFPELGLIVSTYNILILLWCFN